MFVSKHKLAVILMTNISQQPISLNIISILKKKQMQWDVYVLGKSDHLIVYFFAFHDWIIIL